MGPRRQYREVQSDHQGGLVTGRQRGSDLPGCRRLGSPANFHRAAAVIASASGLILASIVGKTACSNSGHETLSELSYESSTDGETVAPGVVNLHAHQRLDSSQASGPAIASVGMLIDGQFSYRSRS